MEKKDDYNQMRFGCLATIVIIVLGLLLHKCISDKGYWRDSDNDSKDNSSVIDNPSRQ